MSDYPYLPVFIDDYVTATFDLEMDEHGVYLHLLMLAWQQPNCMIPDDDKFIAKFLRMHGRAWKKYRKNVLERFFTPIKQDLNDGKTSVYFFNKRLLDQRKESVKRSEKARENASKRWSDDNENNDLDNADADASDDATGDADGHATSDATDDARKMLSNSNSNTSPSVVSPQGDTQEDLLDIPKNLDRRRGSRMTEDWQPTSEHKLFAQQTGIPASEVPAIADKFRDYWLSQPGQKGVKRDWTATWRNWVRRDIEFRGGKPETSFKLKFADVATPDEFRQNEDLREQGNHEAAAELRKTVMERAVHA